MKGHEAGNRTPPASAAAAAAAVGRGGDLAWVLVFAAWVITAAATLGALFFSEIMELPPCLLCWYQRIFMFPLVLLLPVGLFPFDPKVVRYALPLAVVGGAIAAYHQLLVLGIVPESASPCTRGVPCAEVQIEWLGFITIPLLAVAAFASIIVLLLVARALSSR